MKEKRVVMTNALRIRSLPEISDLTDTGWRVFMGQVLESYGISHDDEWEYIRGESGEGWVNRSYIHPISPSWEVLEKWPEVPYGLVGIKETFGQSGGFDASLGLAVMGFNLPLSWKREQMVDSFRCHKDMSRVFNSVFRQIERKALYVHLTSFGGCYSYRKKIGTSSKLSTHSWGIAVDLNPESNAFGAKPTMHHSIVSIFKDHGFVWGGDWKTPDGMHFQYATGY